MSHDLQMCQPLNIIKRRFVGGNTSNSNYVSTILLHGQLFVSADSNENANGEFVHQLWKTLAETMPVIRRAQGGVAVYCIPTKLKSHGIKFVHNFDFSCLIVLTFQNDWATEK